MLKVRKDYKRETKLIKIIVTLQPQLIRRASHNLDYLYTELAFAQISLQKHSKAISTLTKHILMDNPEDKLIKLYLQLATE